MHWSFRSCNILRLCAHAFIDPGNEVCGAAASAFCHRMAKSPDEGIVCVSSIVFQGKDKVGFGGDGSITLEDAGIDPEIGSHFGSVVAGTGWQQIIERTVHVHSGGKGIAHTVCSGHIGAEGIHIAAAFFPLCVS